MEKSIFVFIVEDIELARQMMHDHFDKEQFTYAEVFEDNQRDKIIKALESINP